MKACNYLLQYKTEHKLSYYKLSKILKINQRCLRNIIENNITPTAKTCRKISKLTGISFIELLQ